MLSIIKLRPPTEKKDKDGQKVMVPYFYELLTNLNPENYPADGAVISHKAVKSAKADETITKVVIAVAGTDLEAPQFTSLDDVREEGAKANPQFNFDSATLDLWNTAARAEAQATAKGIAANAVSLDVLNVGSLFSGMVSKVIQNLFSPSDAKRGRTSVLASTVFDLRAKLSAAKASGQELSTEDLMAMLEAKLANAAK
jgi:hypothetical protein